MGTLDRNMEKQTPMREAPKIRRSVAYLDAAASRQDRDVAVIERHGTIVAYRKISP